jgi:uncharacterized coiled-coil protein SlyX
LAATLACSSFGASALEVTAGGTDASLAGLEVATGIHIGTLTAILENIGSLVNHMRICSLTGQAWDITTSTCINPPFLADIASLKTRMDSVEARLAALEARMGAAEANIAALQAEYAQLRADLNTVMAMVNATTAQLAALQAQIDDLKTRMTAAEAVNATQQTYLTSLDNRLTALEGRVNALVGLPSAVGCDVGGALVNNGTRWSCPHTYANPTVAGGGVRWVAASGVQFCREQNASHVGVVTGTNSGSGCNSCRYAFWSGSSWSVTSGCNSCTRYLSITCY